MPQWLKSLGRQSDWGAFCLNPFLEMLLLDKVPHSVMGSRSSSHILPFLPLGRASGGCFSYWEEGYLEPNK